MLRQTAPLAVEPESPEAPAAVSEPESKTPDKTQSGKKSSKKESKSMCKN